MKQRGIAMALLRKLSVDERRSVRHWAMEFVVVVAGVLLALWLQEWMQRHRAVQDMHSAEVAIHGHRAKELMRGLAREGVDVTSLGLDSAVAAYLVDPAESQYLLEDLCLRYAGLDLSPAP